MRVLCEAVVSDILPTLRSLITQELVKNYKLNQIDVSKKLGITQPAVSQYKRGIRGSKSKLIIRNKSVMNEIKKLAGVIANQNFSPVDTHVKLCQLSEKLIGEKIFKDEEIYPGPCIVAKGRYGK